MRNGLATYMLQGKTRLWKYWGEIVSILREFDIGIDLWEDENQNPVSLSNNMSDQYVTAKIYIFGMVLRIWQPIKVMQQCIRWMRKTMKY